MSALRCLYQPSDSSRLCPAQGSHISRSSYADLHFRLNESFVEARGFSGSFGRPLRLRSTRNNYDFATPRKGRAEDKGLDFLLWGYVGPCLLLGYSPFNSCFPVSYFVPKSSCSYRIPSLFYSFFSPHPTYWLPQPHLI